MAKDSFRLLSTLSDLKSRWYHLLPLKHIPQQEDPADAHRNDRQ